MVLIFHIYFLYTDMNFSSILHKSCISNVNTNQRKMFNIAPKQPILKHSEFKDCRVNEKYSRQISRAFIWTAIQFRSLICTANKLMNGVPLIPGGECFCFFINVCIQRFDGIFLDIDFKSKSLDFFFEYRARYINGSWRWLEVIVVIEIWWNYTLIVGYS